MPRGPNIENFFSKKFYKQCKLGWDNENNFDKLYFCPTLFFTILLLYYLYPYDRKDYHFQFYLHCYKQQLVHP
ncbi:MAG: hypothetical protein DI581_07310 [Staphylococcus capitis]|nr:MAG: hypothetical protein DI581_07310 [Staphylococcus capitis]RYL11164.1 hypothetical protein EU553_06035 [Staphylococcus sp. RIT622]